VFTAFRLWPANPDVNSVGMTDVTRILDSVAAGDPQAAELLPLVYDELRKLAADRLTAEPTGLTLQPAALVHEAYLRFVGSGQPDRWSGRGHFFAAAEAMRRILIDDAARKPPRPAADGSDRNCSTQNRPSTPAETTSSPSTKPSPVWPRHTPASPA
jgi:hypothetical protein